MRCAQTLSARLHGRYPLDSDMEDLHASFARFGLLHAQHERDWQGPFPPVPFGKKARHNHWSRRAFRKMEARGFEPLTF